MILAYIYDFVSFLFEKDAKAIKSIILYGSAASGELDKESDIDLFIEIWDVRKKAEIERLAKMQLGNFEDKAARIWYPRGIKNPFSIIVGRLDEERWESIKHDIISNGVLLYGKYRELPEKMQHSILMTFQLNELNQREKMKLVRLLYGYKTKRGGKKYEKDGIVQKYGIKISPNTIIVPVEKSKEFRNILLKFGLTPQLREIWTRP